MATVVRESCLTASCLVTRDSDRSLSPRSESLTVLRAHLVRLDGRDVLLFCGRQRFQIELGIGVIPLLTREVRLQDRIFELAPVSGEDLVSQTTSVFREEALELASI